MTVVISDHSGNSIVFDGFIKPDRVNVVFDAIANKIEELIPTEGEEPIYLECGKTQKKRSLESLRASRSFKNCSIEDEGLFNFEMKRGKKQNYISFKQEAEGGDYLEDVDMEDMDYAIIMDTQEGDVSFKVKEKEGMITLDIDYLSTLKELFEGKDITEKD